MLVFGGRTTTAWRALAGDTSSGRWWSGWGAVWVCQRILRDGGWHGYGGYEYGGMLKKKNEQRVGGSEVDSKTAEWKAATSRMKKSRGAGEGAGKTSRWQQWWVQDVRFGLGLGFGARQSAHASG